jgi:Calcineurin-like phosphoesterase
MAEGDRKDLKDLQNLPRSPVLSFAKKAEQPKASQAKLTTLREAAPAAAPAAKHPALGLFAPSAWAEWARGYFSQRFGPRHPFLTYANSDPRRGVYRLEGDQDGTIRMALAGDWGTGTDEAEKIAKRIVAYDPHYSIHLGDVYYVGGPNETNENFLGIKNPADKFEPCRWPDGSRGTFALNGNHEMYARGIAYFDRVLPAMGIRSNGTLEEHQKASFFCLENNDWRIIALDTGYGSVGWPLLEEIFRPACALQREQIDWLRDVVRPQKDDRRGIVLLGHHQYFSRFDYWYTKQGSQLTEFFDRPVLWFWGHEHRMAIYPKYKVTGGIETYGRCIGHGGMPIDLPSDNPKYPQVPVEFTDGRHFPNNEGLTVGYNGFARLLFQGNRLSVEYVDIDGTVIFREAWRMQGGELQRTEAKPLIEVAAGEGPFLGGLSGP